MATELELRYGRTFRNLPPAALLTGLAVSFLPFTKALTLDIGFPLKIYEALFPFAIFFLFARSKIRLEGRIRTMFVYIFLFWIIAAISSVVGIFDSAGSSLTGYRGGRNQDTIMRTIYLLFNICVSLIALHFVRNNGPFLIKAWFAGFLFAFSYHAYTVISVVLTGDAYLLPGLDRHQLGWAGSRLIPRSGTFEEGNFAGLYYMATLAFALYERNKLIVVLAIVGVAFTLSTAAYAGLPLLLLVYAFKDRGAKVRKYLLAFLLLGVASVFAYQFGFGEKFSGGAGHSAAVRANESMTGLQIFFSNPTIGVGLGGYGFLFDEFEWAPGSSIYYGTEKRIPNNVYVEILSETGFLGFLSFLLFIIYYIRIISSRLEFSPFFAFALSAGCVFLAYPTFNITYLWFFIGASLGVSPYRKTVSQ